MIFIYLLLFAIINSQKETIEGESNLQAYKTFAMPKVAQLSGYFIISKSFKTTAQNASLECRQFYSSFVILHMQTEKHFVFFFFPHSFWDLE